MTHIRRRIAPALALAVATFGLAAVPATLAPSPAFAATNTFSPAASADDAEERATSTNLKSSDLDITLDANVAQAAIGIRFTNLTIPKNATVTNAYIQFTVDKPTSTATSITIKGENVDDAATFTTADNAITGRSKTTQSVSWSPPAWNTAGAAGVNQRTPNLSAIVQAVVNRSGWAAGNDMSMILTGTGERDAESWDTTGTNHPKLVVEWAAPETASPGPTNRAGSFGFAIPAQNLHHHDGGAAWMNARLGELATLGVGWVRTDIKFGWIVNSAGVIDFTNMDAVVNATEARGLKLLLIMHGLPAANKPAGTGDSYGPDTEARRQVFANLAGQVAARYANKTHIAYEVWNEANLDQFWTPTPSITNYVELLKDAYPAIKTADPDVRVLASGTGSGPSPDIPSDVWYTGLYNQGAAPYFDIGNIHPYQDWRLSVSTGNPATGHMALLDDVRAIMDANGDAAIPLWGTEWGAATSGQYGTTEDGQASIYSTKGRDYFYATAGQGSKLFGYSLRDRATYGSSTSHSNYYGVIRFDGTHKPAYNVIYNWIRGG
jgi:hypothetical protein